MIQSPYLTLLCLEALRLHQQVIMTKPADSFNNIKLNLRSFLWFQMYGQKPIWWSWCWNWGRQTPPAISSFWQPVPLEMPGWQLNIWHQRNSTWTLAQKRSGLQRWLLSPRFPAMWFRSRLKATASSEFVLLWTCTGLRFFITSTTDVRC